MSDFLRRFTLASYLVALMFVVNPIVDAATNAWPWFPDSEQWRFGSVGIVSNYLVSVIFGLLLMGAVAVVRRHRRALYVVSGTAGVLTLFLAVISVSYVLDTFQVRGVVREDQLDMFKIGAVKTAFKIAFSFFGTLALSIAGFKAARDTRHEATAAVVVRAG